MCFFCHVGPLLPMLWCCIITKCLQWLKKQEFWRGDQYHNIVVGFSPCTCAQTVHQAPGAQILWFSKSMATMSIGVPRLRGLLICV